MAKTFFRHKTKAGNFRLKAKVEGKWRYWKYTKSIAKSSDRLRNTSRSTKVKSLFSEPETFDEEPKFINKYFRSTKVTRYVSAKKGREEVRVHLFSKNDKIPFAKVDEIYYDALDELPPNFVDALTDVPTGSEDNAEIDPFDFKGDKKYTAVLFINDKIALKLFGEWK